MEFRELDVGSFIGIVVVMGTLAMSVPLAIWKLIDIVLYFARG